MKDIEHEIDKLLKQFNWKYEREDRIGVPIKYWFNTNGSSILKHGECTLNCNKNEELTAYFPSILEYGHMPVKELSYYFRTITEIMPDRILKDYLEIVHTINLLLIERKKNGT
jgi:hypothetical protein